MSEETFPTAVELFEKFRPRFEVVRLVPDMWGRETQGGPGNRQRILLKIHRGDGLLENYHEVLGSINKLDVARSALPVTFVYDPGIAADIHEQLFDVVSASIGQLFEGRVFRLRPLRPVTQLEDHSRWADISFKIDLDGDPIPGLDLVGHPGHPGELVGNWRHFIPSRTPEADLIWTRIRYDRAMKLQTRDVQAEQNIARQAVLDALAQAEIGV